MSRSQTKESSVYDLQETFRWLGDLATMQAFESRALDLRDFYFSGDNYRYRIEIEAKVRFLDLLRNQFNTGVKYRGRLCKWDTIILEKAKELGRFLLGKSGSLDFVKPALNLVRTDGQELRERILDLSVEDASKLEIGKSTLHNLRKRAVKETPFKDYGKVRCRLT